MGAEEWILFVIPLPPFLCLRKCGGLDGRLFCRGSVLLEFTLQRVAGLKGPNKFGLAR